MLLGLGQGGTVSIALMLTVLRSSDAHVAASLSGMVPGIGYTVAALVPLAVVMHDLSDAWGQYRNIVCVGGSRDVECRVRSESEWLLEGNHNARISGKKAQRLAAIFPATFH